MSADVLPVIFACAAALVGACISTGIVLWLVRRWRRLVVPGERDAHSIPMPTAGGIGIVAGFLLGDVAMGGHLSIYWLGAIGLLQVAIIDDLVRPLKVWEKSLLLVAVASVFLLGVIPYHDVWFPIGSEGNRYELWVLGIGWFFWICNVFNFMDGIDGISATQTLCIAGWLAVYLLPFDVELSNRAWLLGAASVGFLFYNFPPSRIFMGDTGSLFIGFCVAALIAQGLVVGMPFYYAIVLLGYYVFDTSYTLLRRMLHGENPLQAHNKHLYQRLVRIGWSHLRVNIWAGALTTCNGLGVYCLAQGLTIIGILLTIISLLVLLYSVLWIERRDACFA